MLVFLPKISLILLVSIFAQEYHCWRRAILSSAVVLSVFIIGATELLSLFRLLTFGCVLGVWGLLTIGLGILYYQRLKSNKQTYRLNKILRVFRNLNSPFLGILLLGVVFISVTVGLIAFVAPPNTWDSMTYHMSRVVHWMQNQSVAHYPTYNLPQLFHPPFAEFTIMHLQILSGGDRFANFVQWFSMIGSIIGVSLIAKELGANVRGQVFAAVFCATIPMGILQGSSTQNDYVVAFWLVCLAYYVLLTVKATNKQYPLFFIGASLGLAILTKSSGYIYSFPFMVWLSWVMFQRKRWNIWKPLLLVATIFFVLNISHYLRNLDLFFTLLGTPKNFESEYKIEAFSLPILLSNSLRNLSLHSDIVRHLGVEKWVNPLTGIIAKIISVIHVFIGVDMNDPRTTYPPGSYRVPGLSFDENVAGNPLHLWLIFVSVCFGLLNKKIRKQKIIITYLLVTISAFIMLCLLLKLQPYQSRHHLSIFVLFSAFFGVVFSQIPNAIITNAIVVTLIITSFQWVFSNKFRPIAAEANIFNMSRIEQYFINRPQLKAPYVEATKFVLSKNCSNIGLSLGTGINVGNQYWEYPLWPLLHNKHSKIIWMQHINVQNISNKKSNVYPFNNFIPCAIISVRASSIKENSNEKMVFNQVTYRREWSSETGYISVLTKS
ncbi:ArnT family glycosyltransferase [Microseira wollei]|uniref:Glycosyltransferase RgtA/B/C/D-like domain-containing protein n=1 Tax=Microseira wollei NIES-4236 TaxID=2530354 RepID=A0AAV3WH36_9CYAN|nr:glycosyltransferase family 39 protein [Microseira wollei]GET38019.1 hypothetical protein MiSe_27730 [Microseira wollei NIES-4236]